MAKPISLRTTCLLAAVIAVLILPACGQLITVPTATPAPTATATAVEEAALLATPTATPAPPTKTALPLTPLPTDTPTLTPTPVVYTIKGGDTLGSIAKQFNVGVAAIQDANGITDPRLLQIGQELMIPVEGVSSETPATPTATPLAYDISGITFQTAPSGKLWCYGEIENTAGVDLQQVQVAVSLFDDKGELLAFTTGYTELDVVPKGKRAPFAVSFDKPPDSFTTYQSVPLKAQPVTHVGSYYLDLEIVDQQGEGRGRNSYSLAGRVRNAGDAPARDVRIVVTGYDEEGKVAAVRKVAPQTDVLLPGRSSDFEINLLSTAGTVVTYTLQAEALREATESK